MNYLFNDTATTEIYTLSLHDALPFSIARRFLYDTADAARLDLLAGCAYAPLAGLVAKMRREETYHLLDCTAWVGRLARGGAEPRRRLAEALERLWPDALCVLAPLPGSE